MRVFDYKTVIGGPGVCVITVAFAQRACYSNAIMNGWIDKLL
jgi:hypothetical protein